MAAPRTINIQAGDRFGLLTATQERQPGATRVQCRCDCGAQVTPLAKNLAHGRTQSCGCLRRGAGNPNWNGDPKRHALYSTWAGMKERCSNPRHISYPRYGGRGITVCDRWRDDFWAFVADMGDRPTGRSIDRIDNDRGYEPDNCRWATAHEQRANRRTPTRKAS